MSSGFEFKTLEEVIQKEISGTFLKGVMALLEPIYEYEARHLREAMHVKYKNLILGYYKFKILYNTEFN